MNPLLRVLTAWLLCLSFAGPATSVASPATDANALVHLLDYIAVDYPGAVQGGQVLAAGEYAEQQEFAAAVATQLRSLPAPAAGEPARQTLLAAASELQRRIDAKAPAAEIEWLSSALKRQIIAAWQLRVAPRRAPALDQAAALYAQQCAGCHGREGRGDGPLAKGLEPAPANFFDGERMAQRSLHGLYNTVSLGVAGTAMKGFERLSEDQRWALAFHVAGLRASADELALGQARWQQDAQHSPLRDLADLSATTARDLSTGASAAEAASRSALLAWLTRHPEVLARERADAIALTRKLLADSLAAAAQGQREQAQRLAIAAYLEGFELAEARLDAVDAPLRQRIEAEMMALRQLLAQGSAAAVAQRGQHIDALLAQAAQRLQGQHLSPTAAGLSAFGILFREGLEAILVLAAIAAGVARAGRRDAMRWVHAGWLAALFAGGLTWLAAERLIEISGATREATEGVTALLSAAILLYVGLWLHGKARAQDWQQYIDTRLGGALSRGALGLLALLSFLAVYREAFETVLFLQALAAQSSAGETPLALGVGAASLALAVSAWALFRSGLRLPLALFFRLSAALLAVLAVVFAGQGVAALQEAGTLAADPLGFVRLPALGVYPTWQTVLAQAAVVASIALTLLWQGRRGDRAAKAVA